MMRFSICVIEPAGYRFSHFLYDLCKYLCFTFEELGYECCMVKNRFYSDRINVILGAHNLTEPDVAKQIKQAGKYIILQSEVLREGGIAGWPDQPSFSKVYVPLMQDASAVWHGIDSNNPYFEKLGIQAERIPRLGYLPGLEEVLCKKKKDIDFLYYGSLTPHRKKLLEELIRRGGNVVCIFDEAAIFRNDYIARTRVHLSPNQGPGINHITAKTLYLLNNRCVVVVERCHKQEWIEDCYISADTEDWADLCMQTLHRHNLDQLGNQFFERYKKLDMTALFQPLLDKLSISKDKISRNVSTGAAVDRLQRLVAQSGKTSGEKVCMGSPESFTRLEALLIEKKTDTTVKTHAGVEDYEKQIRAANQGDKFHPQFDGRATAGLTSIILMTHNRLEQTKRCVKSIRKHTAEDHEIIFVDSGSSDSTVKWLQGQVKENKNYHLIENVENIGNARGCNQGINLSQGEYILLLESDVLVGPGWLSGLLECHRHAPDAGIVGPMANQASGAQQAADDSYQSVDFLDRYAEQFKSKYRHRRIPSRNIGGFCMLLGRSLVEKIGLLDESLGNIALEAKDVCWRSVLGDQRNYIAGDVFVHRHLTESPCDRNSLNKEWSLSMATPEGKKLAVLKAMELANDYNAKGQMDQAVETLINCIQIAPDDRNIYYELARFFIEAKNFPEARDVVASMPEAAKNDLRGLECGGYAREGLGLDDEAAALANQMLSLSERWPGALNLKGVLAFKKDEKDKAQDFFKQAIDADPGYGDAYTNLGVLYWGLDQKEEAFTYVQKGFLLSPAVPDNHSLYHSVAASLGRFEQAEADFAEACRAYPHHKNLTFLLIDLLLQQGKNNAAILRLEDAFDTFGLDEGTLRAALSVRDKIGPLKIPPDKKNTLSLCMIVKNEGKYLVQCLKSVRDIVDEIIVVDTGSVDNTKDIAAVFGAKVFDFPWTGDFSAARNESLKYATGDWILILDADEVISEMDLKELKKLLEKKPKHPAAYEIVTRNYTDISNTLGWIPNDGHYREEAGSGWVTSVKVRLFPNRKGVIFQGPVHEILDESLHKAQIPTHPCKIIIHHYGMLDKEREKQKGERYYQLGKEKYLADPMNVKYIHELAKQAQILDKFDEAVELWLKLLSRIEDNRESSAYQEIARSSYGEPIPEIYMQLASAYLNLERFDDALSASRKAVTSNITSKDYRVINTKCEIIAGSLGNALGALPELEKMASDYSPALLLKAVISCLQGEKGKAREIFELLQTKGVQMAPSLNKMVKQLRTHGKNDQAFLILDVMIANKINDAETIELLEAIQKGQ